MHQIEEPCADERHFVGAGARVHLHGVRQGLLAATSASVRLAQKRAQTERPRLQSAARREKLQAALRDAQTAVGAAQELIQGAGRFAP